METESSLKLINNSFPLSDPNNAMPFFRHVQNKEIIQQWQFPGKLPERMLSDEVLSECERIGVTSLQSYVPWSAIEKNEGKFDFSESRAEKENVIAFS